MQPNQPCWRVPPADPTLADLANRAAQRAARLAAEQQAGDAAARTVNEASADQAMEQQQDSELGGGDKGRQSGLAEKLIANRLMNVGNQESVQSARSAVESLVSSSGGQLLPAASPLVSTLAQLVTGESAGSGMSTAPSTVPLLGAQPQQALAENVRWMVNQKLGAAEINLSPAGMGPVSIKLDLDQESLNVSIVAPHGVTREALETLLPRLREQLQAQGHDQVDVTVSDRREESAGSHQDADDQSRQEQQDSGAGAVLNTAQIDDGDLPVGRSPGHSGTISRYDIYV